MISGNVIKTDRLVPDFMVRTAFKDEKIPYFVMPFEVKAGQYYSARGFGKLAVYTKQAYELNRDQKTVFGVCTNGRDCHLVSYCAGKGHQLSVDLNLTHPTANPVEFKEKCKKAIGVIFAALCFRLDINLESQRVIRRV